MNNPFVKLSCMELLALASILLVVLVVVYKLISEKTELREGLYWEYPYSFTDHIGKHCCKKHALFKPHSDEEAHYRLR